MPFAAYVCPKSIEYKSTIFSKIHALMLYVQSDVLANSVDLGYFSDYFIWQTSLIFDISTIYLFLFV